MVDGSRGDHHGPAWPLRLPPLATGDVRPLPLLRAPPGRRGLVGAAVHLRRSPLGALVGGVVTFTYHGARLDYFDHPYNDTIRNERAVEVAVAMHWRQGRRADGLEVGNVLGHYGLHGHRVADLHEEAPGVENVDVLAVTGSYPWVVALSTVEHVGRDEDPRDDARAIDAVRSEEHTSELQSPWHLVCR